MIANQNCEAILFAGDFPGLDWLGMALPDKPILANSTGTARLLPLTLTIDATDPTQIRLSLGAVTIPVGNSDNLDQATLDNISLLGKISSINLGAQPNHTLSVHCK